MAKPISLTSWNVEPFKGKPERVTQVAKHLKDKNLHEFTLLDIEGEVVRTSIY